MNVKIAVDNQIGIFNMLKTAKDQGRMSHAYLFYVEEGTGKKEMAYALSCLLYCPNGGDLTCDVCKTILEGNHMNVDYIGIQKDKTKISKEQITSLQDEFSKTSLVEGTRIYIIDGIDTATSAAQNSLLKFIEEPINQTPRVGIFLANELSNVVNTIQSRCILEHFPSIFKEKEISSLIEEGIDELDARLSSILTNDIDEAIDMVKNIDSDPLEELRGDASYSALLLSNPDKGEALIKEIAEKLVKKSKDYYAVKEIFLEMIKLKNEKMTVMFYTKYVNVFQEVYRMNMLLNFTICFLEDCLFHLDNPHLSPLSKEIQEYNKKYGNKVKNKLEECLTRTKELSYNVLPKNIFHSLLLKFI
jgi:DNA polymerase III delta prime subunit